MLEDLLRLILHAAHSASINAKMSGDQIPASITRKAVTAAFECALGNGLISITPEDEWPEWIAVDPPYEPGWPNADS